MVLRTLGAALWAVAAGVSVTLQLGGTILLNNTPANNLQHSFYVGSGGVLIGAVLTALLALVQGGPRPQWPKRPWSLLGGIVVVPCFVTTPAARLIGLQAMLMLMLLGMLGMAVLFDLRARRLRLGFLQVLGLLLLLLGVVLDLIDAVPQVTGSPLEVASYCAASLVAGILYTVSAKMNKRLAQDLGSNGRAVAVSNGLAFITALPVWFVWRLRLQVPFYFHAGQWWIWVLIGLQSAFYTLSLAKLPKLIGYSPVFVLVLAGKLASSALADTAGAFSPREPLSSWRCVSVCTMVLGAAFYTMQQLDLQSRNREGQLGGSLIETVSGLAEEEVLAEPVDCERS